MNVIIMNVSEDRDIGIFYLPTKSELARCTNNGDLSADRTKMETHTSHTHKQTHTITHTNTHNHTHTHTHTYILNLTLSPYGI